MNLHRLLLVAFAVLLPLGLGSFGVGDWIRRSFWSAASPVMRLARAEAAAESTPKQVTIDTLTIEIAALRIKERELNELRKLIGFDPPAASRVVPANVIGMSIDPEERVLFLDRGAREGIRPGAAVIAGDHWVIAITSDVREHTAEARLITDDTATLSAAAATDDASPLVVRGAYGTGALLTLIPNTQPIKPGTVITTAGLEAGVPRGLVIGRILREVPGDSPPFRSAVLILSQSLRDIPRIVGVVSPTL